MTRPSRHGRLCLLLAILFPACLAAQPSPTASEVLSDAIENTVAILRGAQGPYTAQMRLATSGDSTLDARTDVIYESDARYAVDVSWEKLSFTWTRTPEATALLVASENALMISEHDGSEGLPALSASKLFGSLTAQVPPIRAFYALALVGQGKPLVALAETLLEMNLSVRDNADGEAIILCHSEKIDGELSIRIKNDRIVGIQHEDQGNATVLRFTFTNKASVPTPNASDGTAVVSVPRAELEETFARGLTRAAEILWRDRSSAPPADGERRLGKCVLRVRDGKRLLLLQGTPDEIGFAHGRLLARDIRRNIDSTLHAMAVYYSIAKKRWFRKDLREAFDRARMYIHDDYIQEMKGLARGAGVPEEEVLLTNMFPELFHCSGFAVSGKATKDGKLYHGRVLDYMTRIGLQRTAAVIVTRRDGAIPFANVSYAGFIGSVSGMNAERIAIGEMGGRGEGNWDGCPMSFLVRSALENARSLDAAKQIFSDTQRTCEYYYVFSDGKDLTACGVEAYPDRIGFVAPGEFHEGLPTPVEDCVLLSAGNRYVELVSRVKADFGRIDREKALALMGLPVATGSNLHNVLFVPQDRVFLVADASAYGPACNQPYVTYDLGALLREMDALVDAPSATPPRESGTDPEARTAQPPRRSGG